MQLTVFIERDERLLYSFRCIRIKRNTLIAISMILS